ncbi:uncharacterized protein LOC112089698 [Eutrema salsugineum]|uniref:uncharacterized protein LOC112089698 n=1 Tax=Eutrema salsugineum TaxID=72664 RepID=UPI000CED4B9F|nr:uncharacterized protein LOC112089698 [Eutrema salsugineum]
MANQSNSSEDSSSFNFSAAPPRQTFPEAIFGDYDGDVGSFRRRMVILCRDDYVNRKRAEDLDVDDVDEDHYCNLDDELVPWSVSKKMKIERMKKIGKRAFDKIFKKSLDSQLKPGCVYGKHGLGIRFRC